MDFRRAALWLLLLLLPAPSAWAGRDFSTASDNVASVADRQGNLITVSNRFDGSAAYVQLTSLNRYHSVNWDRSHNDGYAEQMTAVYLDAAGSVILTGVRVLQGVNYMWTMKYASNGQLVWERVDDARGCVAFTVVANENGDVWAAGSCANGTEFPSRLVHYSSDGAPLWSRSYSDSGRSYVRSLSLDYAERASLTFEVSGGSYGKFPRTVVYDGNGNRLTMF